MTDCKSIMSGKSNTFAVLFKTVVFVLLTGLSCTSKESFGKTLDELFHHNVFEEKDDNMKLICFYHFTNDFNPKIMEDLCTHINVGFLEINVKNNSLQPTIEQQEILSKLVSMKERRKGLKIVISVGGACVETFSSMVENHKTRKMFIKSMIKLLKDYKIDGIDLDWEWPVATNGKEKEKVKFIQLLQEIREEFDRHKKHYILSLDVSSVRAINELAYIVRYIALYVDYVNVMCYDYHFFTKLFPFTGHNAPLYGPSENFYSSSNVNNSIYYWISNSMPRHKIVVGLPTYGHTFKLSFVDKHSVVAPAMGFGSVGQNGFANYQEICKFLKKRYPTVIYDNVSKVPYAYQYPEWISFDNENSLSLKASYIVQEKLGGAMVYSVNADDFNGTCNGNGLPLPLIRTVRSILFNEV